MLAAVIMIITSIINVTRMPCSAETSPFVSFYKLCPAAPVAGGTESIITLPPVSPTSRERLEQTVLW